MSFWSIPTNILEHLTGYQGLWLILVPGLVYIQTKRALIHSRAPDLLSLLSGSTTVFQRYSDSLRSFVLFLTPLFYDRQRGVLRPRGPVAIYSTFLAIALAYTVSLFFLGWSVTGEANIGNIPLIRPYSILPRVFIAIGWLLLGVLVYYSVRDYEGKQQALEGKARQYLLPTPRILLALIGAAMVFGSQYISHDRSFGLSSNAITICQIALALVGFIAIYFNDRYIVGFSYVATACYGLALGVPILIGIPLAVAIATAMKVGSAPILISSAAVPAGMLIFGYLTPAEFQKSDVGALVLAAIACLPLPVTVFATSRKTTASTIQTLTYSGASFLPVWIPVAMSSDQITHPVAYAIMIFWFLVPTLNSVWDSISWWATWALLGSLHAQLQRLVKNGGEATLTIRKAWQVIAGLVLLGTHVVLNILISSLLFLAMFFMVIFGLIFIRAVAGPSFREYLIDVPLLMQQIQADPFGAEGFWLVLLLFVTLAPALFHLFAIAIGVLAVAMAPSAVQEAIGILADRTNRDLNVLDPARKKVARYFAAAATIIYVLVISGIFAYRHWFSDYAFGDLLFIVGQTALNTAQRVGVPQ